MLEHLSIYIHSKNKKNLITFCISMYIMCVCLFSALSRRVGALQISIIIIIIMNTVNKMQCFEDGNCSDEEL